MLKQFKTPKFEGNVFFLSGKYFSDKTIANKKKKLV